MARYLFRAVAGAIAIASLFACSVAPATAQDLDPSGGTYRPPVAARRPKAKTTTTKSTTTKSTTKSTSGSKSTSKTNGGRDTGRDGGHDEHVDTTGSTDVATTADHAPSAEAEQHYDLGNTAYDRNDLDKAIKEYETAIKLDGKYVDAYLQLGAAYYDMSDVDAATDAWERGVALDASVPELHNNLGNANYVSHDYEKAVAEYQKALKLRPSYYDALFGLGNVLSALRKYDEAIPYFQKAIEARGEPYPDARSNLAWAQLRAGKLDDAAATARLAINEIGATSSASAKAWYALAAALTEKPDYAGASDALRKSIGVCKSCPPETTAKLYYSLGRVLEAKGGDDTAAADAYEQYLRLAPFVTNESDVRAKIAKLRGGRS